MRKTQYIDPNQPKISNVWKGAGMKRKEGDQS